MQEVPVIFFARDFDFAHPDTFAAVCGDGTVPASLVRLRSAERFATHAPLQPRHLTACAPPRSRWCCRSG